MVEAILFDLFETLVTESDTRPLGAASLGPTFGCEAAAFRTRWKAHQPAVVIGTLSFREAVARILADLGRPADDVLLEQVIKARVRAKAEPFDRLDAEVLAMVRDLRTRGLRLGVVSNCIVEDVTAWSRCLLAPMFDCSAFSFKVGSAKPEPAIYREAARQLDVDTSDAWFVGDGAHRELEGARAAGLRAFRALWFLRRWPSSRERACAADDLACPAEVVRLADESAGRRTGG